MGQPSGTDGPTRGGSAEEGSALDNSLLQDVLLEDSAGEDFAATVGGGLLGDRAFGGGDGDGVDLGGFAMLNMAASMADVGHAPVLGSAMAGPAQQALPAVGGIAGLLGPDVPMAERVGALVDSAQTYAQRLSDPVEESSFLEGVTDAASEEGAPSVFRQLPMPEIGADLDPLGPMGMPPGFRLPAFGMDDEMGLGGGMFGPLVMEPLALPDLGAEVLVRAEGEGPADELETTETDSGTQHGASVVSVEAAVEDAVNPDDAAEGGIEEEMGLEGGAMGTEVAPEQGAADGEGGGGGGGGGAPSAGGGGGDGGAPAASDGTTDAGGATLTPEEQAAEEGAEEGEGAADELGELQKKREELEAQVETLGQEVGWLQTDLGFAQGDIDEVQGDIEENNVAIGERQEDIMEKREAGKPAPAPDEDPKIADKRRNIGRKERDKKDATDRHEKIQGQTSGKQDEQQKAQEELQAVSSDLQAKSPKGGGGGGGGAAPPSAEGAPATADPAAAAAGGATAAAGGAVAAVGGPAAAVAGNAVAAVQGAVAAGPVLPPPEPQIDAAAMSAAVADGIAPQVDERQAALDAILADIDGVVLELDTNSQNTATNQAAVAANDGAKSAAQGQLSGARGQLASRKATLAATEVAEGEAKPSPASDGQCCALEGQISSLQGKVGELDAKAAELSARQSELDAQKAELDARKAELDAAQAEAETALAEIQGDLGAAQGGDYEAMGGKYGVAVEPIYLEAVPAEAEAAGPDEMVLQQMPGPTMALPPTDGTVDGGEIEDMCLDLTDPAELSATLTEPPPEYTIEESKVAAEVEQIYQQMDYFGTDEVLVAESLERLNPAEVSAAETMVAYEMGIPENDLSFEAVPLVEQPQIDPFAYESSFGTDEAAIGSALQGLAPEEIDSISAQYGGDLYTRLPATDATVSAEEIAQIHGMLGTDELVDESLWPTEGGFDLPLGPDELGTADFGIDMGLGAEGEFVDDFWGYEGDESWGYEGDESWGYEGDEGFDPFGWGEDEGGFDPFAPVVDPFGWGEDEGGFDPFGWGEDEGGFDPFGWGEDEGGFDPFGWGEDEGGFDPFGWGEDEGGFDPFGWGEEEGGFGPMWGPLGWGDEEGGFFDDLGYEGEGFGYEGDGFEDLGPGFEDELQEQEEEEPAQPEYPVDSEKVAANVDAMFEAMDGLGTDEEAINAALSNMNPAEMAAAKAAYAEKYGQPLQDALGGELSGDELAAADRLLNPVELTPPGDVNQDRVNEKVDQLTEAMDGFGTDEAAIQAALQDLNPEERAAAAKAYEEKNGVSIYDALKDEMSGEDLDAAFAQFTDDAKVDAQMAQLEDAMGGFGTDEEGLQAALEGLNPAEIEALKAKYAEKNDGASLAEALGDELSGEELDKALAIVGKPEEKGDAGETPKEDEYPEPDPEAVAANVDTLFNAMDGCGTDEEAIKEALKGMDPREMQAVKEAYEATHGRTLMEDLNSELGEDDLLEVGNEMRRGTDWEENRPVPSPEDQKKEAQAEVEKLQTVDEDKVAEANTKLFDAMDGAGTNEDKIYETLKTLNPGELAAVKKLYAETHEGLALEDHLFSELGGDDLSKARGIMMETEQKLVNAQATAAGENFAPDEARLAELDTKASALHNALNNQLHGDGQGAVDALRGIKSPAEAEALIKSYNDHYCAEGSGNEPITMADLEQKMAAKLSGSDFMICKTMLTGDQKASAVAELRKAAGDVQLESQGMHESMKLRGVGEEIMAFGYEFTDLRTIDKIGMLAGNVSEDDALKIMGNLDPKMRAEILAENPELKTALASGMEGEGTDEDKWKAYEGTGESLEEARQEVRSDLVEAEGQKILAEKKKTNPDAVLTPEDTAQISQTVDTLMTDEKTKGNLDKMVEEKAKKMVEAKVLAADLKESMYGSGSSTDWKTYAGWTDDVMGANLDTDKAKLAENLEKLKKDPELYKLVSKEYAALRAADEDNKDHLDGTPLSDQDLLGADIKEEMKVRDWDVWDTVAVGAVVLTGGGGAAAMVAAGAGGGGYFAWRGEEEATETKAASDAMLATKDLADFNVDYEKELEGLKKLTGGKEPTADDMKKLIEAAKDPEKGANTLKGLEVMGLSVEKLEEMSAKKETAEVTEQAGKMVAALEDGRITSKDGFLDIAEDKEYKDSKDKLDKAIAAAQADPSKKAELDKLQAQLTELNAERDKKKALLDAKVKEMTGGKGVTELIDENLGVMATVGTGGRDDAVWAKKVWENGALEPHEELYVSIAGAGSDKERAMKAFKGKSPAEIEEIAKKFQADFGDEAFLSTTEMIAGMPGEVKKQMTANMDPMEFMKMAIGTDYGGKDMLDLDIAMQGDQTKVFQPGMKFETEEAKKAAANQRLQAELANLDKVNDFQNSGVLAGGMAGLDAAEDAMGMKDDTTALLKFQSERIKDFAAKNKAALEAGDEAAWKEFEKLKGYHAADASEKEEFTNSVSDTVVTTIELVGAVAAAVATGGGASPLVVAVIAGAAGGAALLAEIGIKGDAISEDERWQKMGKIVLDVALAGGAEAMKVLKVAEPLTQLGTAGINAAYEKLTDEAAWRSDKMLNDLVATVGLEMAKEMLSQMADSGIEEPLGVGNAQSDLGKAMKKGAYEAVKGQAIDIATDKDVLNGDISGTDLAKRSVKAGMRQGFEAGLDAYGEATKQSNAIEGAGGYDPTNEDHGTLDSMSEETRQSMIDKGLVTRDQIESQMGAEAAEKYFPTPVATDNTPAADSSPDAGGDSAGDAGGVETHPIVDVGEGSADSSEPAVETHPIVDVGEDSADSSEPAVETHPIKDVGEAEPSDLMPDSDEAAKRAAEEAFDEVPETDRTEAIDESAETPPETDGESLADKAAEQVIDELIDQQLDEVAEKKKADEEKPEGEATPDKAEESEEASEKRPDEEAAEDEGEHEEAKEPDKAAEETDADATHAADEAEADASSEEKKIDYTSQEEVDAEILRRIEAGENDLIMDTVLAVDDPKKRGEMLELMDDYAKLMTKPIEQMTPAEMDRVLYANKAMMETFLESGVDLRKFKDEGAMIGLLTNSRQSDQPTEGGSVGSASNTEGSLPKEIISILGLDYENSKFLEGGPGAGEFTPKDNAFFVDMPMTPELAAKMSIPMDERLIEHAKNSDDPELRALAENLSVHGSAHHKSDDGLENPFQGKGGTAPALGPEGRLAPEDRVTRTNQELNIDTDQGRAPYPDGTEAKWRGPDGETYTIGIYTAPSGSDPGGWNVDLSNLPPDVKARLEAAGVTETAANKPKTPPPEPTPPPASLDEPSTAPDTAPPKSDADVETDHAIDDAVDMAPPTADEAATEDAAPAPVVVDAKALEEGMGPDMGPEVGYTDADGRVHDARDMATDPDGNLVNVTDLTRTDDGTWVDADGNPVHPDVAAHAEERLKERTPDEDAAAAAVDEAHAEGAPDETVADTPSADTEERPKHLAVAEDGSVVDVNELKYQDGKWVDGDGNPVDSKVAKVADDQRKVELHQHFKGILDPAEMSQMMFPGTPEESAAKMVAWLQKQYDQSSKEVSDDLAGKDTKRGERAAKAGEEGKDASVGPLKKVLDDPNLTPQQKLDRLLSAVAVAPDKKDTADTDTADTDTADTDKAAKAGTPFDATYDPRGLIMDVLLGKVDPETGKKNQVPAVDRDGNPILKKDGTPMMVDSIDPEKAAVFLKATLDKLKADGIDYVEPQGKPTAFGEVTLFGQQLGLSSERVKQICDEAGVDMRFLNHRVSEKELAADRMMTPVEREAYENQLRDSLRGPDGTLDRSMCMGLDVCGPEGKAFTDEGMENFKSMFKVVQEAAQEEGQKMVLRPHVGEGYGETADDRSEGLSPERAKQAKENIDQIIKAVTELRDSGQYVPGGDVVIRLGHVTNVTPEQAAQMAALGLYAEVNIGSNMATGATPRETSDEARVDRHPLLDLMAAGVPVVLSTDAHGVMGTDLTAEYQAAEGMIDRFKAGQTTLRIGDTDYDYETLKREHPEIAERIDISKLHKDAQTYRATIDDPLTPGGGTSEGPGVGSPGPAGSSALGEPTSVDVDSGDSTPASSVDVDRDALQDSLNSGPVMTDVYTDKDGVDHDLADMTTDVNGDLVDVSELRSEDGRWVDAEGDEVDPEVAAFAEERAAAKEAPLPTEPAAPATPAVEPKTYEVDRSTLEGRVGTLIDGTEAGKVEALRGLDAQQLDAARQMYKEKTGRDLDADLAGSDSHLGAAAAALAKGDKVAGALAQLKASESEEWFGTRVDREDAMRALQGLSADEIDQARARAASDPELASVLEQCGDMLESKAAETRRADAAAETIPNAVYEELGLDPNDPHAMSKMNGAQLTELVTKGYLQYDEMMNLADRSGIDPGYLEGARYLADPERVNKDRLRDTDLALEHLNIDRNGERIDAGGAFSGMGGQLERGATKAKLDEYIARIEEMRADGQISDSEAREIESLRRGGASATNQVFNGSMDTLENWKTGLEVTRDASSFAAKKLAWLTGFVKSGFNPQAAGLAEAGMGGLLKTAGDASGAFFGVSSDGKSMEDSDLGTSLQFGAEQGLMETAKGATSTLVGPAAGVATNTVWDTAMEVNEKNFRHDVASRDGYVTDNELNETRADTAGLVGMASKHAGNNAFSAVTSAAAGDNPLTNAVAGGASNEFSKLWGGTTDNMVESYRTADKEGREFDFGQSFENASVDSLDAYKFNAYDFAKASAESGLGKVVENRAGLHATAEMDAQRMSERGAANATPGEDLGLTPVDPRATSEGDASDEVPAAHHDTAVDESAEPVHAGDEAKVDASSEEPKIDYSNPEEVDAAILRRIDAGENDLIMDTVLGVPDPAKRGEMLELMDDYARLMTTPIEQMTPAEMDRVLYANKAMRETFLESGIDLRKFKDEGAMVGLLTNSRQSDQPTEGGSVGSASNTEGALPKQIISILGLDYENSKFLEGGPGAGQFAPKDNAFFVDMPMTPELADKLSLAVDQRLIDHARNSNDPELRALADVMSEHGSAHAVSADGLENPFQGKGGTAPALGPLGRLAPGDRVTRTNQELNIDTDQGRAPYPDGTAAKWRGPDGETYTIGIYTAPSASDPGGWNVDLSNLPPEVRARLEAAGVTETAANKPKTPPPQPGPAPAPLPGPNAEGPGPVTDLPEGPARTLGLEIGGPTSENDTARAAFEAERQRLATEFGVDPSEISDDIVRDLGTSPETKAGEEAADAAEGHLPDMPLVGPDLGSGDDPARLLPDLERDGLDPRFAAQIRAESDPDARARLIEEARRTVGWDETTHVNGVPVDPDQTRLDLESRYPEIFEYYGTGEFQFQNPEMDALRDRIKDLDSGSMNEGDRESLLAEWKTLSGIDPKNPSAEFQDLRINFYVHFERNVMGPYQAALEAQGVPLEQRAQIAHMWRNELKEITRQLQTDQSSAAFLRELDRVYYGTPQGETFDSMVSRYMNEGSKRNGNQPMSYTEALQEIIGSAQRSNKGVTGS